MVESSAEQGAEVVVQPSAAIATLVDDDGVAAAVLVAEQFAVDVTEVLAVHGSDVNIGYATV